MGATWTLWLLVAALAAFWAGLRLWRRRVLCRSRRERHLEGFRCAVCGYIVAGLELPRCPECGALRGFKVPLDQLGLSEQELRELYARKRGASTDAGGAKSDEGN
jgi:hypothetical protein